MKWLRRIGLVVLVLALAASAFYWFLPASVAVPFVARRARGLVLDDLSGTLWQGRAGRVATREGLDLGTVTWTLGRDVILGRTHLDIHLDGRSGRFDGHMEQTQSDIVQWSGVDFRLDAAALSGPGLPRELIPVGVVEGKIPQAELQGNWPLLLDADVNWRAAAVKTPEGHVPLGGIVFKAHSAAGVLHATLADNGDGSLAVDARLAASPLGWRLDGALVPRLRDTALTHLIARFGPVRPDGSVSLARKAGLAPAVSP
ncbi:type II secretion system protein N [Luteibacter aegosomaticola]|uniref:type II secretion system protein N n=1 Tax=Luteibacter aegosomaticola TaxID=2911538 RepID=UPI001FF9148F|nr:type II secretion system protein N [Luteibacter aegosomaticola]UPG89186.1 type II secretion system protein N [Luteibacter aegosomaticola]